jgi:hypothetical protein
MYVSCIPEFHQDQDRFDTDTKPKLITVLGSKKSHCC